MSKTFVEKPGILTEAEARPILEPYLPALVDVFHSSFDWVQAILDQDPERRRDLDASIQAGMVYCRFTSLVGRRLGADKNVVLKRRGRMLRALIGKRIALRCKKLRKTRKGHLCAGNVKTNAQSLIYYQLGIDKMQGAHPTEVTFGYTTDPSNRSPTGVYLTCPISWYSNKWTIPLEGEEFTGQLPFAQPADPASPMPNQATFIITPKTKKGVDNK
jgi:hypothetical protein